MAESREGDCMINNFEEYASLEGDDPELLQAIVHLQSVFRGRSARSKLKVKKKAPSQFGENGGSSSSAQSEDDYPNHALSPMGRDRAASSGNEESGNEDLLDEDESSPKKQKKHGLSSKAGCPSGGTDVKRPRGNPTTASTSAKSSNKGTGNPRQISRANAMVQRKGRGRPKGSLNRKTIVGRRLAQERVAREAEEAKAKASV